MFNNDSSKAIPMTFLEQTILLALSVKYMNL